MRRAVAVAAFALLALAGTAHAQRFTKVDGNRLLGICTSTNVGVNRSCESYIDGVSDSITLYQQMATGSNGAMTVPKVVCVPSATTGTQLKSAVVAWLRAHPADRSRPAVAIVERVLHERYPCK